jgi:phosphoribosylformylglycinamidine cyclo-ligase
VSPAEEPEAPGHAHPRPHPASRGALDYRTAGVDIGVADDAVRSIGDLLAATHGPEVVKLRAGFAGIYRLPGSSRLLLSSVDGVGTKIMVAVRTERFEGIGRDLVAHCVNDVLVHGGRPLFFLDYVGTARLEKSWFVEVVRGLAATCGELGCALIGGETAEMPGVYHGRDFDLVGAIVGEVEEAHLVDGAAIAPGDVVLGLASDGLHTNGYSLARRILADRAGDDYAARVPGTEESWADALLRSHRPYLHAVSPLVGTGLLHGMAHITGGGLPGNLSRVIPDGLTAEIDPGAWTVPPVFAALVDLGEVTPHERYRAFNMGVGYVLVVPTSASTDVRDRLVAAGERVWQIGEVRSGGPGGVRLAGVGTPD